MSVMFEFISSMLAKEILCFFPFNQQTLTATCKLCNIRKEIKFTNSSKSNLVAHIKACHKDDDSQKPDFVGMETITSATLPYGKQEEVTNAMVDLIVEE